MGKNHGWRGIISSSTVMSFALMGDALIYAILPIYATEFGLTLPMVGIILSINRFVRVFAYGLISHYVALIGLRKMCFIAAMLATFSTAIYGYSTGFFPIFLARIIWGIAYAILVLITLAYAIEFKERTGARVGVSQTIQRFGPIFSLLVGSWMVGMVGPKMVFLLMTIPTSIGILIALYLPKHSLTFKTSFKDNHNLSKPTSLDLLFFIQGY